MLKNRRRKILESPIIPETIVHRSYCEKHHQILFDKQREQESSQRYEFSENESLVNSLESSTCSSRSRRATTTSTSSPPSSSHVKTTATSEKKTKNGNKYVDFLKEEEETSSRSESIDNQTVTAFEKLSLSTNSIAPIPRVVKPKDILKRPSMKKIMIYPPEGQKGEPMTLRKLRSKIQCRVSGNQDTGFRYKVYYLQTFISDKWLPIMKNNYEDDDSTD